MKLLPSHPSSCERWGFSMMSRAQDERYLHYIISRYAAFRNIGRSMANEYGLLKHKTTEKTEEVLFFYNGLRPNEAHSSISLYGN